jgi:hypothetical protein
MYYNSSLAPAKPQQCLHEIQTLLGLISNLDIKSASVFGKMLSGQQNTQTKGMHKLMPQVINRAGGFLFINFAGRSLHDWRQFNTGS